MGVVRWWWLLTGFTACLAFCQVEGHDRIRAHDDAGMQMHINCYAGRCGGQTQTAHIRCAPSVVLACCHLHIEGFFVAVARSLCGRSGHSSSRKRRAWHRVANFLLHAHVTCSTPFQRQTQSNQLCAVGNRSQNILAVHQHMKLKGHGVICINMTMMVPIFC